MTAPNPPLEAVTRAGEAHRAARVAFEFASEAALAAYCVNKSAALAARRAAILTTDDDTRALALAAFNAADNAATAARSKAESAAWLAYYPVKKAYDAAWQAHRATAT